MDDCMGAVLKITPGHNILHPLYPLLSPGLHRVWLTAACNSTQWGHFEQFKCPLHVWQKIHEPLWCQTEITQNGKMVTQIQIHSGPSKLRPSIYSAKDNRLQMVWVHIAADLFWFFECHKNTAHTFLKKGQKLTNGNLSYITTGYLVAQNHRWTADHIIKSYGWYLRITFDIFHNCAVTTNKNKTLQGL